MSYIILEYNYAQLANTILIGQCASDPSKKRANDFLFWIIVPIVQTLKRTRLFLHAANVSQGK